MDIFRYQSEFFMRWTYFVAQKTKIAISLTIVIVMVLATNFLNKRQFENLQDTFTSVYRDRLMAEIYIYQFATILNEKNHLFNEADTFAYSRHQVLNDSIALLISDYEETMLTDEESVFFTQLKERLIQLSQIEGEYIHEIEVQGISLSHDKIKAQYEKTLTSLALLSDIQRTEGKRLIDESRRIVSSGRVTLQIELMVLIVIGVLVQVLIFSARPVFSKINQRPDLN